MPKHVVLAGRVINTPEEVLEVYRPPAFTIPGDEWELIRPLVVAAAAAARFQSPSAALLGVRYTARLVAWARRLDMPLNPETILRPEHVERFVASQLSHMSTVGQASAQSNLRRVARAAPVKAPWPPPAPAYRRSHPIAPPYSESQVAGFRQAAESQATERRTRVLTVILTLGLGAGLRPSELLTTSAENVRPHPVDGRLWVISLPDRVVPVLQEYTPQLIELCAAYPEDPLIGRHKPTAKNPLEVLRSGIQIPDYLKPLRCPRLRTTWMTNVLNQDVRISEFLVMAGTVSAKTLEVIAPHIAHRWEGDEYLFKGAGLDASP